MLQSMAILKWNRISILHENNLYAIKGAEKLRQESEKRGICVVTSYGIDVENGVNTNQITHAIDDMSNNKTTGVVLFGSSTTANVFFQNLNYKSVSQIPIVLVSEGINMNKAAFQSSSGNIFAKAKGSLGVAPFFREVDEFNSYWKSLFTTSESLFNSSVTSNPWLQDVFDELTGCSQTNCPFQVITDQLVLDKYFKFQPLFLQYAILAAHAIAKLVQNHCSSKPHTCFTTMNDFRPGDLVSEIKGMTIDFEADFTWR